MYKLLVTVPADAPAPVNLAVKEGEDVRFDTIAAGVTCEMTFQPGTLVAFCTDDLHPAFDGEAQEIVPGVTQEHLNDLPPAA
jgi:hypothetical protein